MRACMATWVVNTNDLARATRVRAWLGSPETGALGRASFRARCMRAIACVRSSPQTISLPSSES